MALSEAGRGLQQEMFGEYLYVHGRLQVVATRLLGILRGYCLIQFWGGLATSRVSQLDVRILQLTPPQPKSGFTRN